MIKRLENVSLSPVESFQATPRHKTGFILSGLISKIRIKGKVLGVTCSNTRFKRCAKSGIATQQLAPTGRTTEHSSFTVTMAIASWIYELEKNSD